MQKKEPCTDIIVKFMCKKGIKVVAFDLDNTLYNENKYFEAVINFFCETHNLENNLFIADFYKIERKSKDIFGDLLKSRGMYEPHLQEELFNIYQSVNIKLTPFPVVPDILKILKEKSINTAIITNGDLKVQQNKINSLLLNDAVDLIVYARKWGREFEKPHPKAFEYLMEYFSCLPEEVLFIGDNEENDIAAATKVGMQTYKVENSDQLYPVINIFNQINLNQ